MVSIFKIDLNVKKWLGVTVGGTLFYGTLCPLHLFASSSFCSSSMIWVSLVWRVLLRVATFRPRLSASLAWPVRSAPTSASLSFSFSCNRRQISLTGELRDSGPNHFESRYLPVPTVPIGRVADPDLFGRIRIWNIFTGSGSYRYFGNVKLYKQGKNILKIVGLHICR